MLSLWESIRRRFNELIQVEPQIRIIKLDNARYGTISDSLAVEGDYLCILKNDADDLYIALNRPIFWHKVPKFDYGLGIFEIKQAFRRIYIKHSAVSGGEVWLFAGFPEELEVRIIPEYRGNVGIIDKNMNKINPAKEETLSSIDSKLRTPIDEVFVKDVSVGTTSTQVDADTNVREEITLLADSDNTDTIYVGNSENQLFPLVAGASLTLRKCSLSKIYVKSGSGTQTLHVIAGGV